MKKLKLPKFHWVKILSLFFFVLLLGAYENIFAIGAKYAPGTTLDPACVPGEINCTVEILTGGSSYWTQDGNNIYYNDGNVGIGTNSPTAMLDIKLNSIISYFQEFYEDDDAGDSLNDATYSGTYTGNGINFMYVWIDSEGSPDTFSYSDNYGDCPEVTGVPITGGVQNLCLGISIQFENTNGHSLWDEWDYQINEELNSPFLVSDIENNIYFNFNPNKSNLLIGYQAGFETNPASDLNFIGNYAGYQATGATGSNFIGNYAGYQATEATGSNFIGGEAGNGATSAFQSNFLGPQAGESAITASNSNFLGLNAGQSASNAFQSNFLGFGSGQNSTQANNSNFFGRNAGNTATNANHSNFFGDGAGYFATNANNSNFIGYEAGGAYMGLYGATEADNSNFLGYQAGYSSLYADNSNFLGYQAGYEANLAATSNFLGYKAGYMANSSYHSNFIGLAAGYQADQANHSNFLGFDAGYLATNAYNSNFIGTVAGFSADNAANSIFIGQRSGEHDNVNNTGNTDDFSILIGKDTNTGGFSNSIAIGGSAVNTATNQFMIGSATRPINTTRINGSASTQCTITTGVGIACTSDERLKTNIVDLSADTLDKLIQVRTVNFNWKEGDNDMNNIGFLAQDLENYFPELVSTDSEGYKSVYYSNMTPILVEAIRELDLKVKEFSSFDLYNTNSLAYLVKNYLADVGNGLEIVFFGEVRTKKLCLDGLCIDKTQLEQLLNNVNSTNNSSTDLVETETDNQPPETGEIDIADVVPAPDTLEETLMPIEVEEIDTQENTPAEEIVPILE